MSKLILTNEGVVPPPPPTASVALFAQGDELYSIDSFGVVTPFGGGNITITTNAPLTGGGTGTSFTLGLSSGTPGGLMVYSGGSWGNLPIGSAGQVLTVVGGTPSWQTPTITTNVPVQGAVIYFDGTDWIALPPGVAGQVLVTNGPGNDPSWQNQLAGSGAVIEPFNCPVSVNVLDAVYLSSADTVDKADATDETNMPCVGVVISKSSPTTCDVVMSGSAGGFAGLTVGATYYVSLTAGSITNTVGSYPSGSVIQRIGYARNTTTLVVDVDRDYTVL